MGNQINIKSFKKRRLLELLQKTRDKRRYHYLYLLSCYFSQDAARVLINEINKLIRISEVLIYIDRKTAVSIGKDELRRFCNSFRNVDVKLYAVDANCLFHSKAYALISFDNDNDIYCGSLVVGSANLTGQGLVNRSGNIESLLDTQDIDILSQFVHQLDALSIVTIEDIEKFTDSQEYNFKYALLQEGVFIHKWTDNLGQYLSIRYQLNENGKSRIGDEAFKQAGFNVEAATISKRYFQFDYDPPHLEGTENLIKNYGIETYLGHWIPSSVFDTIFEDNEYEKFCNALKKQIYEQLDRITDKIKQDFDFLKAENLIQLSDVNPVESFQDKINDLLENDLKLKRIFSKYETFYLPYDLKQKEEIEELYYEMLVHSESRKRENITMKALLAAVSSTSLELFRNIITESMN